MRRPILAANWKMNLGRPEDALEFVRRIRFALNALEAADRVVCPPFTSLPAVAEALAATSIAVGAQNMHFEEQGAYTGEISAAMLAGLCKFVILGHSERRAAGGAFENDAAINRKVRAALAKDLTPIVCVGENLAQMEAGETQTWVSGQVASAFEGLSPAQVARCVIAYEPIWAIGTGKAATPVDANRVIALSIRGPITDRFGEDAAQAVRVQYGGSATVDNIAEFMAMPEIDGALVGGASLKPDYIDLVRRAIEAAGSH
jgi:triosephosphate isomerase